MHTHTVPRLANPPASPLDARWDTVPRLAVDRFHPHSSLHHPVVHAQLGHSGDHLHLRFVVHDRHVRSCVLQTNGPVCTDSCVEFFVEPLPGLGYFNIEMNAGGTLHMSHITNPTPLPGGGFAGCTMLDPVELATLAVATTLPKTVDPELAGPLDWAVCASIPIALFARHLGSTPPVPGTWRGNFYKCADLSSHPHWASWAPIGERLAFHVPEHFGVLRLA
jgi:hypothetical protein